jgi:hypothetical protein
MRARRLLVLVLVASVALGCSAATLKSQKDGAWSFVPRALPDDYDALPNGYAHPLRPVGFLAHPIGVALEWVLVKPFYMLAGLAPEWFGLTVEDAQKFQSAWPELVTPQNAPRNLE